MPFIPDDEFVPESNFIPESRVPQFRQEAAIAQQEAGKSTARRFGKELVQTFVGSPARFGASVKEIPQVLATGNAPQTIYNIPGLDPFKSFQSEAETTAGQIIEGQRPLSAALKPSYEVPLAGAEAVGVGKLAAGVARFGRKIITKGAEGRMIQDAINLITPKTSQKGIERIFKEGRLGTQSMLKSSMISSDPFQKKMIDAVTPLLQDGRVKAGNAVNTLIRNAKAMSAEVSKINQGVKQMLIENPYPLLNKSVLRAELNRAKSDLDLIFKSDATVEKTYNAVADAFVNLIKRGDNIGVFDARQAFDKLPAIKKLLETAPKGENIRKTIILTVRGAANQYIAKNLPPNNPFRAALRSESYLLKVIENMATKIDPKILQQGKLRQFTRSGVAKTTAAVAAGGLSVEGARRLFSN